MDVNPNPPTAERTFVDSGRTEWQDASPTNGEGSPTDALKAIGSQLAELREYATYLVAAKIDGIKLTLRNLAVYAALGVIGLLAGGAIIGTASVLLVVGMAQAIGAIFEPNKPWVGYLIVGVVLLGLIGAGTYFALSRLLGASRKQTVNKYEERKRQQQLAYGHDVRERATHGR